jgi:hypothetical protein
VVLLACTRFIDQTILEEQGIPAELQWRLNVAFRITVHDDIPLWTRLGKSKWNVFTPGVVREFKIGRRGGRRHRRSRRVRGTSRTMIELWTLLGSDDEASDAVARDPWVSYRPTSLPVPRRRSNHSPRLTSCSHRSAASQPAGSSRHRRGCLCRISVQCPARSTSQQSLHVWHPKGCTQLPLRSGIMSRCRCTWPTSRRHSWFKKTTSAFGHLQGQCDDLELRSAVALVEVDGVRQQHTHDNFTHLQLQLLQKHLQDLVVLSCSRFISNTILQSTGIPSELHVRLDAAFWVTAMEGGYHRDDLVSTLHENKDYLFGSRARFHGKHLANWLVASRCI